MIMHKNENDAEKKKSDEHTETIDDGELWKCFEFPMRTNIHFNHIFHLSEAHVFFSCWFGGVQA